MADLIVVGFDTEDGASLARFECFKLQKEYLLDLEDAVVVRRTADGKVHLDQSVNLTALGFSSGLAMDKTLTKRLMDASGIRTPRWQLLRYRREEIPRLAAELPLPCAVKTTGGGSSLGVFLPETRPALAEALEAVLHFGDEVIVEERIFGRDLAVGVLGEQALPPVEMIP